MPIDKRARKIMNNLCLPGEMVRGYLKQISAFFKEELPGEIICEFAILWLGGNRPWIACTIPPKYAEILDIPAKIVAKNPQQLHDLMTHYLKFLLP